MAVTFSDLYAESGLKVLEEFLSGKTYISGDRLTKDDIKVYAAVVADPGSAFPNVSRWYACVFSHLAASFPGKAAGVNFGGKASPVEESQKEAAAADDDDLDLFGDETEEEKKAAEEREAAKKSSSKKKESGKSSVLMDVKPWDDETDMKKLEEAVRSVQMEGLLWGACKLNRRPNRAKHFVQLANSLIGHLMVAFLRFVTAKLAPVGYGIKKLQIMLTIVDDLVSVDNLIEDHLLTEPANEYIQSCDIVAFNKI
ncbi:hypothetical protein SAY87_019479 [Trapa incisa]|uniref:Translation elongation factor EF1B beta/delta subunit guanine nucleotide exchange domain-containing protein n=1 Tax=Trapa incisa TaxID=236973 RepID=A0AAN7Q2M6_9MYRT|nr:hypothetical protein SAY87_019479 [Trapa incisa]